jgi:virginiamycin B lyase
MPRRPAAAQSPTEVRVTAWAAVLALFAAVSASASTGSGSALRVREYPVPAGSHPHDVAPARDGGVWYTAQGSASIPRRAA